MAENLGRKVTLHPKTNPSRIEKGSDGRYQLFYIGSDGGEASVTVDQVMMATGRTPKTKGLGLEVRLWARTYRVRGCKFCQAGRNSAGAALHRCHCGARASFAAPRRIPTSSCPTKATCK